MGKLKFELITKTTVTSSKFDCGVPTINEYVDESYFATLSQHAYTYNIVGKGKSLGYIQVMFRDIKLSDFPDEISDIDPGVRDYTLSAIHIRFIAIDLKYQKNKIGTAALKTMIQEIQLLAQKWPISVITIDAREELVHWYKEVGFKEMISDFAGQEGYNVAMYYSCIQDQETLQKYMENEINDFS